jgi:tetratricopeptide (TPR) repeat protein
MIFWSRRSLQSLQNALEKQRLKKLDDELFAIYTELLSHCFPNQHVFVKDRQGGFNQSKAQHALFIEVFGNDSVDTKPAPNPTHVYKTGKFAVVKIGYQQAIDDELLGYQAILPSGSFFADSRDNSVLLSVKDHKHTAKDSTGKTWKAIEYQDALQRIGDTDIRSLEQAVLFACQANRPTYQSVLNCIREIFIRLDESLYRGAYLESSANATALQRIQGLTYPPHSNSNADSTPISQSKILQRVEKWTKDMKLRNLRQTSNQLSRQWSLQNSHNGGGTKLACPIETAKSYMSLFAFVEGAATDKQNPKTKTVKLSTQYDPDQVAAIQEQLVHLIPTLTRGRIHGDLHGRNIQVGLFKETAHFPVVFDYEFSGPDKLIAWDMIKLEYEIKGPAIIEILENVQEDKDFFEAVIELELSTWKTDQNPPPIPVFDGLVQAPLERLRSIINGIRQQAALILGKAMGREDWEQEYRFLSMLYVANSVEYGYTTRQRLAAWISGAVAVEDSQWHLALSEWDQNRWRQIADSPVRSMAALQSVPLFQWQSPHAYAKNLLASGRFEPKAIPEAWQLADGLLKRLTNEYPTVGALWEDRLVLLLETNRRTEFKAVIEEAKSFIDLTSELLCRLGRIGKEDGVKALQNKQYPAASKALKESIKYYQQAFDEEPNYYPAINLAALYLYLAATLSAQEDPVGAKKCLDKSTSMGGQVLSEVQAMVNPLDADFWLLATEAEAMYLSGQEEQAKKKYGLLGQYPDRNRDIHSAMRQYERNQLARSIVGSV